MPDWPAKVVGHHLELHQPQFWHELDARNRHEPSARDHRASSAVLTGSAGLDRQAAAAQPSRLSPIDETRIQLLDGKFRPTQSWIYVWVRPSGEVLYVGATGLPLAARVWLHANDERPEVGRVRAVRPEALVGEVEVRGFGVASGLDRGAVRSCLESLLASHGDPDLSEFDESVLVEATRIRDTLSLST